MERDGSILSADAVKGPLTLNMCHSDIFSGIDPYPTPLPNTVMFLATGSLLFKIVPIPKNK